MERHQRELTTFTDRLTQAERELTPGRSYGAGAAYRAEEVLAEGRTLGIEVETALAPARNLERTRGRLRGIGIPRTSGPEQVRGSAARSRVFDEDRERKGYGYER